ncbi:MAG: class I SAM-dependent methyltransferase [Clostridiales bacterium]|jgi:23S rRNA (cytosine1962-C5)-methyltransferase|nr:class I SAM-dependent methyltransferase [Clostridiales bacterium]
MWISDNWKTYELIDARDGKRLERFGDYTFVRPDPTAFWSVPKACEWKTIDAVYNRASSGGGAWDFKTKLPAQWVIDYQNKWAEYKFNIRPMGFKHMGIFPEQACNWDYLAEHVEPGDKLLNLFAYTGGASVAALAAGASVVHVDSSKGIVGLAKANVALNKMEERPIRYIVDDAVKFVKREIRRGNRYECIVLDPPSYGRGPNGEIWKLENEVCELLTMCKQLLSDKVKFVILNSYTTGVSSGALGALAKIIFDGFKVSADELALPISSRAGLALPCGCSVRIEKGE